MTSADPQPGWYPDPSAAGDIRWWDGAQWTRYSSPSQGPSEFSSPVPASGDWSPGKPGKRGIARGNAGTIVLLLIPVLGTVMFLYPGVSHLWAQYSGTPGRVDVVACTGEKNISCTGVWRPAGKTQENVRFPNGEGLAAGSTVDAHIQGDQAFVSTFPNEVFSVIIPTLLGCVSLYCLVYVLRREFGAASRRNRRT
jgi:hypothetical protein